MVAARLLPGLPPYGPPATSFPNPGAFSEGLVVEFTTKNGATWTGNFRIFGRTGLNAIHPELGSNALVVIAGGAGYIIDAEARKLVRELGVDIQHIWFQPELAAFVASNGLWFEAFDEQKILWRSRRFSWKGVRILERSNMRVLGEALDPHSEQWVPFSVDLTNGYVLNGSYTGPSM